MFTVFRSINLIKVSSVVPASALVLLALNRV